MFITRLRLKKLYNTRDLGGIPAGGGKRIRKGKLVRSGKLSDLPKKTAEALKEFGVTTVFDMRTDRERNYQPDTLMDGVKYISHPIITTPIPVLPDERTMRLYMKKESYRLKEEFGDMDAYMTEVYRSILFSDEGQGGLKAFLKCVIEEEGCILWHCGSGKDRAGIGAMLLEGLLGVSERFIYEDYLASREFWHRKYFWNKVVIFIAPTSVRFKKIFLAMMRLKREYLETVIEEMKARYGGIVGYCKQVLGITDEDIKLLKEKYLV